jgi:hypothetical protein
MTLEFDLYQRLGRLGFVVVTHTYTVHHDDRNTLILFF